MKYQAQLLFVVMACYLLTGCSSDSGSAAGDTCVHTVYCTNGGEIQACATAGGSGYYLLRGVRYDCSGSGVSLDCNAAALSAVNNCTSPYKATAEKSAEESYLLSKMENVQLRKSIDILYNDLGDEMQQDNQQ